MTSFADINSKIFFSSFLFTTLSIFYVQPSLF